MKNIIKKIILITIISVVFIPLTKVSAVTKDVKTLTASQASGTITYSGTTDNGVLAVTCRLYDSNNVELFMKSSEVNDNKFNDTFTIAAGTYTVSCANYDGGAIVSKTVDQYTEITSINITLDAPVAGEKVNIIEVNEGGFGYQDQDKLAEASTTDEGYEVEAAHYVKGKCSATSNECEEYFEGTFEEGKDYYVMIFINAKNNHKLTTTSLDNIKINGENPEEIFTIYGMDDYTNTKILAKIKATKKQASASTTTTVKTGDNIMTFIILGIVSVFGMISTIIIKKRKTN